MIMKLRKAVSKMDQTRKLDSVTHRNQSTGSLRHSASGGICQDGREGMLLRQGQVQ